MELSRRHFLARGMAFGVGFAGLASFSQGGGRNAGLLQPLMQDGDRAATESGVGYGPLLLDPENICDLPKGFTYKIVSRMGDRMDDGLVVAGQPDGMASFAAASGLAVVVRNHELQPGHKGKGPFGKEHELLAKVDRARVYDIGQEGKPPMIGGTSTFVWDTKEQKLVRQYQSLVGTKLNCAGGPTPWGSWLTCEEDNTLAGEENAAKNHGYVFEVPAREDVHLITPEPLKAMGRFRHEACAVDPKTGIVYMTEDHEDGLLYRYIPKVPGSLHQGGKLQMLAHASIDSYETGNQKGQPRIGVREKFPVRWMDCDDVDAPKDDLRGRGFTRGAARFMRNEGMWYGHGSIYFAATSGGTTQRGQLWRYTPSPSEGSGLENTEPGMMELFVEPDDASIIENADNITVSPWGDLMVCEDGVGIENVKGNYVLGVTPQGEVYKFMRNRGDDAEVAGVCFSPDGSTMFVNIQKGGITLAITGPWRK